MTDKFHGPHYSPSEKDIPVLISHGFSCTQFMPGGKLSYDVPADTAFRLHVLLANGIKPVVHTPLSCYVVSNKENVVRLSKIYLKKLNEAMAECNKLRSSYYHLPVVIHAGVCDDTDHDVRIAKIVEFCSYAYEHCPFLDICIENDVGSKKGTRIGSVMFLAKAVRACRAKGLNNVWLCVDTNHAWGNPDRDFMVDSVRDWNKIIDLVKVVHMNGIPEECERFTMKDRHSSTLIVESRDNAEVFLKKIYKMYFPATVFFITERNDLDLSIKDYEYLEE